MHEFSIAQSICEMAKGIAEEHHAQRVERIRLRVGVVRQIVPELLETAMGILTEDTVLAGAALEIETEALRVHCNECGYDGDHDELIYACPRCGSMRIRCDGGDDLTLLALEIDEAG